MGISTAIPATYTKLRHAEYRLEKVIGAEIREHNGSECALNDLLLLKRSEGLGISFNHPPVPVVNVSFRALVSQ